MNKVTTIFLMASIRPLWFMHKPELDILQALNWNIISKTGISSAIQRAGGPAREFSGCRSSVVGRPS